jgi:hypothetical protein
MVWKTRQNESNSSRAPKNGKYKPEKQYPYEELYKGGRFLFCNTSNKLITLKCGMGYDNDKTHNMPQCVICTMPNLSFMAIYSQQYLAEPPGNQTHRSLDHNIYTASH